MGEDVRCPRCGSEMIKRQAKKGKNTGGYFYGCSRFPSCRGTVDIDSQSSKSDTELSFEADTRPYIDTASLKFPITLEARPRAAGLCTVFVDSLALPDNLLRQVSRGDIDRNLLSSHSKWRLDFTPGKYQPSDIQHNQAAVLSKVVNRGCLTRLSGALENRLLSITHEKPDTQFNWSEVNRTYQKTYTPNIPTQWMDGSKWAELDNMTAEEFFYKRIALPIIGAHNAKDILPQVLFKSLVLTSKKNIDQATLSQRVDFLITHNSRSIVVEIDDPTHIDLEQRDEKRDEILKDNGLEVYRINTDELLTRKGKGLSDLASALEAMYGRTDTSLGHPNLLLATTKIAHNFQLTLVSLLLEGKIPAGRDFGVYFDPSNTPALHETLLTKTLQAALEDLKHLDLNIAKLYDTEPLLDNLRLDAAIFDLVVSVNDQPGQFQDRIIYIQDINFPLALIQNQHRSAQYLRPTDDDAALRSSLSSLLQYIFRFDNFRPNQIDGVIRTLNNEDTIVLLPTGSGKSIIYQLLSLIMPGMTLVVEPLVSLIEDQVDNLHRAGIDRATDITASTDNKDKVQQAIALGAYSMVYVSPERLQIEGFRNSLSKYCIDGIISVCAIDEAHCVSEWGHDFRTSYLNLARTCRNLLKSGLRTPPILALTGTASESVLRDMQRDLDIDELSVIRPSSFDRKEIDFILMPSHSNSKSDTLQRILEEDLPLKFNTDPRDFLKPMGDKTNSGIVFCVHVGGDFGVRKVHKDIRSLGVSTTEYFGSQTRFTRTMSDEEWTNQKRVNASNFKNNKHPVLVSTKSFGMGVDKPNVRFTIHYGLPQSIEAYYQEAGRAGRDRKQAYSYLIVSNDHPERNRQLLSPVSSLDELNQVSKSRKKDKSDDITRALWFHTSSFSGITAELESASKVLGIIGDLDSEKTVSITANYDSREGYEKTIYRLLTLGIVRDYTVNFASNEFVTKVNAFSREAVIDAYGSYVSGYQDDEGFVNSAKDKLRSIETNNPTDFILRAMEILLEDFIYKIIENSRRRAFSNLVSITEEASMLESQSDRSRLIRKRILEFLGNTHVDIIKTLTEAPRDLQAVKELIKPLRQSRLSSLYGEVGRTLQAYPEHPSLLLAHQALEFKLGHYSTTSAVNNIIAIIRYGINEYNIEVREIIRNLSWCLSLVRDEELTPILDGILGRFNSPDLNRLFIEYLPENKRHVPLIYEYAELTAKLTNQIGKEELWTTKN